MRGDDAIDFGRVAEDYARHRQGFPDSFLDRLRAHGVGSPGQRVLDLGTGTGQLGRGLARCGAIVTGLDRSSELLDAARELDRRLGLETRYVEGRAEATGLPAASFDAVTAAQCWRWFERPLAAAEARRLLVPGGLIVVAQLDWLPLPGSVVEATEALILEHNPAWELGGLDGLPTHFVRDLERAGFEELETFSFDLDLAYTRAAWRGRIRASAGVAASLSPDAVRRFDEAHEGLLAERFPADPLPVPHRAFAILGRKSERTEPG